MDKLIIKSTTVSPSVIMDAEAGIFVISGESRPENAGKFYPPIIDWISRYKERFLDKVKGEESITFEFKLDYFNSTSAKFILDILKRLDSYYSEGHKIKIKWYYLKQDEDMQDSGMEFSKLVKIPIELVEQV